MFDLIFAIFPRNSNIGGARFKYGLFALVFGWIGGAIGAIVTPILS
jgi:hypothetical protein